MIWNLVNAHFAEATQLLDERHTLYELAWQECEAFEVRASEVWRLPLRMERSARREIVHQHDAFDIRQT